MTVFRNIDVLFIPFTLLKSLKGSLTKYMYQCLAKILKYRILYSSCKEKCSIQCVQKCFAFFQLTGVSLLSNSKWKGCCLKVQAAKESFLTRYRYMFQIVKSLITLVVFFMQGCGEYFCFISVLLHYSPAAYMQGFWQ